MNAKSERGVSLIDLLVVVSILGILAAMSFPAFDYLKESAQLGSDVRDLERTLQEARLKAVTSNRPIRVRFNCPSAGQYRMVEVIGTSAAPDPKDSDLARCQESAYPYPPKDREPLTRPNHDGPLRQLSAGVEFGAAKNLEFLPSGTVRQQEGSVYGSIPSPGTTEVTVVKGTTIKKITVNSLGKITLVP